MLYYLVALFLHMLAPNILNKVCLPGACSRSSATPCHRFLISKDSEYVTKTRICVNPVCRGPVLLVFGDYPVDAWSL